MEPGKLFRLTAFSDRADGGNPAGVWLGDELPAPARMLEIAADVGFSETAFIAPASGRDKIVRYYSPEAEVSFCGHATIASGVQLGRLGGAGLYALQTAVGTVDVNVREDGDQWRAALTSVEPRFVTPAPALLSGALAALGWQAHELDDSIAPAKAYAGAWHLVLAAGSRSRLRQLDYDFDRLKVLMLEHDLTTLQLVWRESNEIFHARNPFPVGGVVEDPATGAAAAALGGYLRESGLMSVPSKFRVHQGVDMGRPSELHVEIPATGGIIVSGVAVDL